MSFLEEVSALNSPATSRGCKVKLFIDSQNLKALEKEGKEPLTNEELLLARETNTLKAIHRALVNRGFKFSDNVLANHLKGDCPCLREAN